MTYLSAITELNSDWVGAVGIIVFMIFLMICFALFAERWGR